MKKYINNKILDLMGRMGLLESNLMEMAFHKKDYIKKIENVTFQINSHILKLLLFGKNSGNFDHWLKEITGWIQSISGIELKRGTKIKEKELFFHLYTHPLDDTYYFEKLIPSLIKEYKGQSVVWDTIPYVKFYNEYKKFYLELSKILTTEYIDEEKIKELILKNFTIK